MKKLFLILPILALFCLSLGGCSSSTEPAQNNTADNDFSPYDTSDEEPFFGDSDLEALAAEEVDVVYSEEERRWHDSIIALYRPNIYRLRIIWGNLEGDEDVADWTDWSGSLTAHHGLILPTRTIAFEAGQDSLFPVVIDNMLYPIGQGPGYSYLEWISHTKPHYDGIATRVLFNPLTYDLKYITFETGPLTITFTEAELADLDTMIVIGPGQVVEFKGSRFEPHINRYGNLIGRWWRNDDGDGEFHGLWRGHGFLGCLKGHWEITEGGEPTFVGKMIDARGRFEGLIKGNWWPSVLTIYPPRMYFRGNIYQANGDTEHIGYLHGRIFSREQLDSGYGGYFTGRWCLGNTCCRSPLEQP